MSCARRASNFVASSSLRTRRVAASPCFRAFSLVVCLLGSVRGPVERCAFSRLARICAGVAIGYIPTLSIACDERIEGGPTWGDWLKVIVVVGVRGFRVYFLDL